jgi:hypothetical protein
MLRQSATRRTTPQVKVWPSGDFTVGNVLRDRHDTQPSILEGITKDATGTYYQARQLPTQVDRMGLSVVPNSRKPKNRLSKSRGRGGLKGITADAKRMVRSACTIMECKYGRRRLGFLTGTIPSGLTMDEILLINQNASYLAERTVQEVIRELARRGLDTQDVVAVIEMQLGRYLRYREPCMHIHFLFPGRLERGFWLITTKKLQDIFCRQVENLLGHAVERKAMTNVEKLKKSASNEMAKYLSKACKASKEMIDEHPDFIPKSWVFIPHALRREVKAAIKIHQGETVEVFRDSLKLLETVGILKSRPVQVELEERHLTIGHAGFMCPGYSLEQFLLPSLDDVIERVAFLKSSKLRRIQEAA